MKKINRKGFTLVELLAVIVVISLVLGLSAYGIINVHKNAKEKAIAINEESIREAARIYSSEANESEWKVLNKDDQYSYFCTTIQRLKNAGLLKKEVEMEGVRNTDFITVQRNKTSYVINNINVPEENNSINDMCGTIIKFYKIIFDLNEGNGNIRNIESEVGVSVNIPGTIPTREGYRFVGWTTEKDGEVIYNVGDSFNSLEETTYILYAKWEKNTYTVNFNGNGSTSGNMPSITCTYDNNCTLPSNKYSKIGHNFIGWSLSSNGEIKYTDKQKITNSESEVNSEITLYAMWEPAHKVYIKFTVNGGTIKSPTTSASGVNYSWKTDTNGIISRSKNNSEYNNQFFSINYSQSADLPNYNNSKYMKITKTGYAVSSGSIWKCVGECNRDTYDQTSEYYSDDFCDASNNDCYVTLEVNWANLLSPIFTASDGIISGRWHNKDYNLSISSENADTVSYQYKTNSGSYQNYSDENKISPPEGKNTYIARTKKGSNYSSTETYESWLDKTAPTVPTINNSSNGNWTSNEVTLIFNSTDNLSGIEKYQYSEDNSNWSDYPNSNKNEYEVKINKEENITLYVRACDYAGNCSESNSTNIKIDTKVPSISFRMLNDGTPVSNNYYGFYASQDTNWFNFTPTLEWTVSDAGGVNGTAIFSYNAGNNYTLNTNTSNRNSIGTQNGNNYIFTETINTDGYRYVSLKACDLAGNCTDRDVYFKFDKKPPTVSFKMLINGGYEAPSDYYSSSATQLSWFYSSSAPYLRWQAEDSGSNINTKALFSYNAIYLSDIDATITGSEELSGYTTSNSSPYYFTRNISWGGYRYVKIEICDNAGNCTESPEYFKFDSEKPIISYNGNNGNYLNLSCQSGLSGIKSLAGTQYSDNRSETTVSYNWNNKNYGDSIELECINNAGISSQKVVATYKKVTTNQTVTTSSCVYNTKCQPYYNGSSINNPCSTTNYVSCGGGSKKRDQGCYTSECHPATYGSDCHAAFGKGCVYWRVYSNKTSTYTVTTSTGKIDVTYKN